MKRYIGLLLVLILMLGSVHVSAAELLTDFAYVDFQSDTVDSKPRTGTSASVKARVCALFPQVFSQSRKVLIYMPISVHRGRIWRFRQMFLICLTALCITALKCGQCLIFC